MDAITLCGQGTVILLIRRLCVRVAPGVHEPPEVDLERFLSMIHFSSREKLSDLPDFQLDS